MLEKKRSDESMYVLYRVIHISWQSQNRDVFFWGGVMDFSSHGDGRSTDIYSPGRTRTVRVESLHGHGQRPHQLQAEIAIRGNIKVLIHIISKLKWKKIRSYLNICYHFLIIRYWYVAHSVLDQNMFGSKSVVYYKMRTQWNCAMCRIWMRCKYKWIRRRMWFVGLNADLI